MSDEFAVRATRRAAPSRRRCGTAQRPASQAADRTVSGSFRHFRVGEVMSLVVLRPGVVQPKILSRTGRARDSVQANCDATGRTRPGGSRVSASGAWRTRVVIRPDASRAWWIAVRFEVFRIRSWRRLGMRKQPSSLPARSSFAVDGERISTTISGSVTRIASAAKRVAPADRRVRRVGRAVVDAHRHALDERLAAEVPGGDRLTRRAERAALGAGVTRPPRRHRDRHAVDEFPALALGARLAPGDERVGGHEPGQGAGVGHGGDDSVAIVRGQRERGSGKRAATARVSPGGSRVSVSPAPRIAVRIPPSAWRAWWIALRRWAFRIR